MSNSLQPHELQHARPPCPSPTPRVHPNPCPLSRCCHPTNGRKVAIQILEFFDRQGITVRRGDYRRTAPQKLERYGPLPPVS